jgi:hypothetical protein
MKGKESSPAILQLIPSPRLALGSVIPSVCSEADGGYTPCPLPPRVAKQLLLPTSTPKKRTFDFINIGQTHACRKLCAKFLLVAMAGRIA